MQPIWHNLAASDRLALLRLKMSREDPRSDRSAAQRGKPKLLRYQGIKTV